MSRIAFRKINFKSKSKILIAKMIEIVAEYEARGLRLTARQLYYQFVARAIIPNTVRSYKNLTATLADARYAGLIDWNAIEDRGRVPTQWREYDNMRQAAEETARGFRLRRWEDQPVYAELWVEKQALAGVLEPLAAEFHATLMVNKGYSSASAMFESAMRFRHHMRVRDARDGTDRGGVLFYLGDHDPSGEDMVRDIADRLAEFGAPVDVRKVALTMDQVEQYNPPPNPAKRTDSRFEKYADEHGTESWEVDALPPDVLETLIREAFEEVIDADLMEAVKERETELRDKLTRAAKRIT